MDFCNEFTLYDQYSVERVLEKNHVRDCVISVLSNCVFIIENKIIRALAVIDDFSFTITFGKVESLCPEINKPRVGLIQLLCLEYFYKNEPAGEVEKANTMVDKEIISCDKVKSFKIKKWS